LKQLLLLLLITFGLIGLANAEYIYHCETSEDSFFYNHSKQELTVLKPQLNFDIIEPSLLLFWRSPFINTDSKEFIINDYEDYQNFNATLTDEKDIFSNLTYENGSLTLTWMNKDSSSLGAYFANCSESYLIVDYDPPPIIIIDGVMTMSVCDDLTVDITYEYEDEDDKLIAEGLGLGWGEKSCVISIDPRAYPDVCYKSSTEFVLKELVSDHPLCIEAEKNND